MCTLAKFRWVICNCAHNFTCILHTIVSSQLLYKNGTSQWPFKYVTKNNCNITVFQVTFMNVQLKFMQNCLKSVNFANYTP